MELPDATTTSADPSNPQNVVKHGGLPTDIKITFKNKTIIAPLQKPEIDNQSNVEQNKEECTSSNNDVRAVPSRYPSNIGKQNYALKQTPRTNKNKITFDSPPMKPANMPLLMPMFMNYPKGIPKSFLLQPQPDAPFPALAPAAAPTAAPASSLVLKASAPLATTPEPATQREDIKLKNTNQKGNKIEYLELPAWIRTVNEDCDEEGAVWALPASSGTTSRATTDEYANKRLNVFDNVGPLVPPPKRSRMTINLLCNKTSEEMETETKEDDKYVPLSKRPEVVESKDELIMKLVRLWPYKQEMAARRIVSAYVRDRVHNGIEFEKLIDESERVTTFLQITVAEIPEHYTKERVLELVLDQVKDKHFVPFFIELTSKGLKFLVANHRNAVISLFKTGLRIRCGERDLMLEIAGVVIKFLEKSFVTKLLRKLLLAARRGDTKLVLRAFCQDKCIKHFIYFPLNRVTNQITLRLLDVIQWKNLIELDLSENKLKSLEGFELAQRTPRLRHLNLSNNQLDKMSVLLSCRGLTLKSLLLEGNPLCNDYYTDPARYIKVVKIIFPSLKELDGVELLAPGEMPPPIQNFCPTPAISIVEKYLETFYPLLEAAPEDRRLMADMYDEDCTLTITHNKYCNRYSYLRAMFAKSRALEAGNLDEARGGAEVAQLLEKWPPLVHDRTTFVVDVLHYSESTAVVCVSGAVKTIAKKLSEDEQLLGFKRTVVLAAATDTVEYKICNEMLYWDNPSKHLEAKAFSMTSVKPLNLNSTKFESCPDDDLKDKLVAVFSSTTGLTAAQCVRYLEPKQWDIRAALEYFLREYQDQLRSSKVYVM